MVSLMRVICQGSSPNVWISHSSGCVVDDDDDDDDDEPGPDDEEDDEEG